MNTIEYLNSAFIFAFSVADKRRVCLSGWEGMTREYPARITNSIIIFNNL